MSSTFTDEMREEMRRADVAKRAARVELFRAAVAAGTVQEQTVIREIEIPPVDEHGLRFTRVKLGRTTFFAAVAPEDAEPYDEAYGWAYQLTAKGEISKRDTPRWRHLPAELVPLFYPFTDTTQESS